MKTIYHETDRSSISAFRTCPRYRLLGFEQKNEEGERVGIEGIEASLPLANGIFIHNVLAELLGGGDLTTAVEGQLISYEADLLARGMKSTVIDEHFMGEQRALLCGLSHAWDRTQKAEWLENFNVLQIEKEEKVLLGVYKAHNLEVEIWDRVRLDSLLERKSGGIFYREVKTASGFEGNWIPQWDYSIQVCLNTIAIEKLLGHPIDGVIIEGVNKGERRKDTAKSSSFFGSKIQYSPLCYAYEAFDKAGMKVYHPLGSGKPPTGASKFAIWQRYTTDEWMDFLGEGILKKLFCIVPPIYPSKQWKERLLAAVIKQEGELAIALETNDESFFPMHEESCYRFFDFCPMLPACWQEEVRNGLIESGLYTFRVPHHETE